MERLRTRAAQEYASGVLLVVDQLEEVYTLVEDPDIRHAFMDALCTAADDAAAPVRVVFTLRDDFFGRLAETPAARAVLGHVTVLTKPGPDALEQTLEQPLTSAGYTWEDPELIHEMVRDVCHEAAALPLLRMVL